ncbi:MAG: FAD-dependent oxidoreductase [Deltaproteobacteria bacterium]|nr:FAD-dependent oxidoreductase [Deltaproteobacteria bacterium]
MKDFDVIVVGAGLGGLSAATALSQAGKRVLLLEKHNVPGGYATSFLRGRFEFDVALHELSGVGGEENRGPLWGFLNAWGVAPRVKFVPIAEFYRCVLPGLDVTVPFGREHFEAYLANQFPKEASGIRKFTGLVFDIADEAMRANMIGAGPASLSSSDFPHLTAYSNHTVAQAFDAFFSDQKLRALLGQLCNYLGQPPAKLTFINYVMGLSTYVRYGPVHIRGTSQALSQAFVETIESYGGQVWLNNGAARILTSGDSVQGVLTQDGTEISSSRVVCNANPMITCLELIGREKVPEWYLRRLGAWSVGYSTFNVFLGLDCTSRDLGLKTHETFVGIDYDLDKYDEAARKTISMNPLGASVTAYNAADPEFSPPGTAAVVLTLGAYGAPWLKLSPAQYLETKSRLASKVIELAEIVAPGIRNHIEVLDVATPLTNARYSENPGGSYAGFAENRQCSKLGRIPSRGPLKGLYFANAWVNMGGGFMPSILSGFLACQDLLQDTQPGGPDPSVMERIRNQMDRESQGAKPLTHGDRAAAGAILSRLHPNRMALKVDQIIDETPSTKTLRIVPAKGSPPLFRAGQYLSIVVHSNGMTTSRAYTISSAPGKPHLDITIRRKEGGFVSPFLLSNVKPDDVLEATGPHGTFFYEPLMDSDHLVFLAGGSGVTPFMSIIRETVEQKLPLQIHLLYGSRSPDDIIFGDELKRIAATHLNIEVDFVISEPPKGWSGLTGLLDAGTILSTVGPVDGKTFFICGPAPMHVLCEGALESLGVPRRRIKKEAYGPPDDVTREAGWPAGISAETRFEVCEERSGKILKAKAGEPLMVSLERAGLVVPSACRSGECALCRTRLVSGNVFIPSRVRRRWSDEQAGYIHPCMSYPLEDLRIKL